LADTNSNKTRFFDYSLFNRILKLALPFKASFIGATLLAIGLAILQPLQPLLVQQTVDKAILNFDGNLLMKYSIILVALLCVNVVFRYYFIFVTNFLGQSIIRDLRVKVFKHQLGLKLRVFDKTPIGTATTRTINDVETINNVFSQGLINIIADLLMIITILIIMFVSDWRLTLVILTTFPMLIYATYWFKESIKKSYQKVRTQVAKLNAFLQEHISGMYVIQVFSAEKKELEKFKIINDEHRNANVDAIWAYSIFFPIIEIITATALGLMVWFGAGRVINNATSIGVLIAFIMYINMLFRPLRMLADKFNVIQMGMVAAERVFNVIDLKAQIKNTGTKTANTIKGAIDFKNVWFAYDGENHVIKDVSFSLNAGETLAIVGATGAGKSSIINILNRFYPIQKGAMFIDGVNVEEYQLESLRSKIGLVLQDVFLFSGSVMENITLRNKNISEAAVYAAAKEVGADVFIEKLPGGFDYKVMERGATLSVGQRQLVSFIRALVFNPSILILDEATSSVDSESEILIQNATEQLVKNRTSIVIAHRLSTIQNADKIMVLDKGEIKELGTHAELLALNGYYKNLFDMQFSTAKVA